MFPSHDPEGDVQLTLDLNDVTISKDESHTRIIPLTDTIDLYMKYPDFDVLEKLYKAKPEEREVVIFDTMLECVDMILKGDEVYKLSDESEESVKSFVESLSSEHLHAIKKFFDTVPKVRIELPYINSKGEDKTFVIEGTESFFI